MWLKCLWSQNKSNVRAHYVASGNVQAVEPSMAVVPCCVATRRVHKTRTNSMECSWCLVEPAVQFIQYKQRNAIKMPIHVILCALRMSHCPCSPMRQLSPVRPFAMWTPARAITTAGTSRRAGNAVSKCPRRKCSRYHEKFSGI